VLLQRPRADGVRRRAGASPPRVLLGLKRLLVACVKA
jgi:hypothetical protein